MSGFLPISDGLKPGHREAALTEVPESPNAYGSRQMVVL